MRALSEVPALAAATQAALASAIEPRTSIAEQTYQRLRSMIIERTFVPGTIMTERRVADASGISRTPLRAALARLEGEGLVTRIGTGSVMIRSFSLDELLENLRVRRLLEVEAAGLAAGRIPASRLAVLRAEAEHFRDDPAPGFEAFWAHDDALHDAIAAASGVRLLYALVTDLRAKARMCNLARMPPAFDAQGREHLAIIDAISAGDPDRAREAASAHSRQVEARLVSWTTGRQSA